MSVTPSAMPRRGRRSSFTEAERRDAVERATTVSSPAEVARELGVSAATVYRWAQGTPAAPAEPARVALSAACLRMLESGSYAELSIAAVARAAGVSAQAARHHFDTKERLFRAAIDDLGSTVADGLAPVLAEITTRTDRDAFEIAGDVLVAGLKAVVATDHARLLFQDLGLPRSDDPTTVWHERFALACVVVARLAARAGRLEPVADGERAGRLLATTARAVTGSVFTGLSVEECERVLRELPGLVIRR